MYGPLRACLLNTLANLDLISAMPCVFLWTCQSFNIPTPLLTSYVQDNATTLSLIMRECGVTKKNIAAQGKWTATTHLPSTSPHRLLTRFDKEAKYARKN